MRARDLLEISGLADLVYVGWELLPPSPKPINSPAENGAIGYTLGFDFSDRGLPFAGKAMPTLG